MERAGRATGNGRSDGPVGDIDFVTGAPVRPDGTGMYLHWDGRKNYRTHMPVPRVLEPVKKLSGGAPDTGNLLIEGDNLQVMVSLRPQYRSRIDVAYLDPPYNTGKKDFRYSDRRFHDPNADSDDAVYVSNEDGGRHTKWLNYMGPRLWLVWELLADHGVCFVSINDIELFRLGMLMDEIFGESNRLGVVVWKQAADNNPTRIAVGHEYILCYAKREEEVPRAWSGDGPAQRWMLNEHTRLKKKHRQNVSALQTAFQTVINDQVAKHAVAVAADPDTDVVDVGDLARYSFVDGRGPFAANRTTENPHPGGYVYDVVNPTSGKVHQKPKNGYRFPEETMRRLQAEDRIIYPTDHRRLVQLKKYLAELQPPLRGIVEIGSRGGAADLKRLLPKGTSHFANPKPTTLMELLIGFAGDSDALILDPFAGSGTTGHAVLRLNAQDGGTRRFIMIEEGERNDRYCRTLIAPRLKAAIKQEGLTSGYEFLETGRRLNREAILDLEREAITSLIIQTDITGSGGRITRVDGEYVIASNGRHEAICLKWNGRSDSTITSDILMKMFEEAKRRKLNKPLRVYGSTCVVGETDSFRFCQIPDEIVAALSLSDEAEGAAADDVVAAVETLEAATQRSVPTNARR